MKRFKPYFCQGCGCMVTREPWPHLDRGLLASAASVPKAPPASPPDPSTEIR